MATTSVIQTAKAGAVSQAGATQNVHFSTADDEILGGGPTTNASLNRHPLGVRPSGNALTADQTLASSMGIFGRIPDTLVLLCLEYLDQKALQYIGYTCKGLFAFAAYDQLWRDLALRVEGFEASWQGNWRSTVLQLPKRLWPRIDCRDLFSDALYRPFQCANLPLRPFASHIPSQNQISYLKDLTREEFVAHWSDRPFILTDPVKDWPVFKGWTQERLLARYGTTNFRAEAVDWTLNDYLKYMNDTADESPLYLFDRVFVEKMQIEVGPNGAYLPPSCFAEDLFILLGDQRPDHRWLIVGPERSGSTFHKDPNATSAWNAVLWGSKYWIMFPNSVMPPGVFVSDDQSEVTSPLSIAEWLLTFHEEAREVPGCVEGICGPGEVLHVPSGWWHLVVNLEPAAAITQNFVPTAHLRSAVNFLKNKPAQVSGFEGSVKDPYSLFMARLQDQHPDLYDQMASISERKRKWEDVVAGQNEDQPGRGGFSFGLGEDDLEDEA